MKSDNNELEGLARQGRWLAISTVAKSGAGHVGGPFSAMDILIALFFSSFANRSAESEVGDSRPIYSLEGALVDWPVCCYGFARIFPDRRIKDIRQR